MVNDFLDKCLEKCECSYEIKRPIKPIKPSFSISYHEISYHEFFLFRNRPSTPIDRSPMNMFECRVI